MTKSQSKKSVCVYCSHRDGAKSSYINAARDTGALIARLDMRLVYGAGDIGLMGAVADAAMDAGAETFGVIPQHLLQKEVGKRDLTSFVITENMHERKKVMVMNADAFVLLPGGLGSLDEFFELITWRQLGLHAKPCFIYNVDGYWDALIALINNQVEQGFVPAENMNYFTVVTTIDALESKLNQALS